MVKSLGLECDPGRFLLRLLVGFVFQRLLVLFVRPAIAGAPSPFGIRHWTLGSAALARGFECRCSEYETVSGILH
jgi:hypothetical protein